MNDDAVKALPEVKIRPLEDTDIEGIVSLDEKISGTYRPDIWEQRVTYYFRRDPEASAIAEADGKVVGFMLAEVRSGEFGLEEPSGWIEVVGVDPALRGRDIGRQMADHILENFRRRGVGHVRTLVHGEMEPIAKFFGSIGFEPEPITAFVRAL